MIIDSICNIFGLFERLMEHLRITMFVFPRCSPVPTEHGFGNGDVKVNKEKHDDGIVYHRDFLFRKEGGLWKELTKGKCAIDVDSFPDMSWMWIDNTDSRNIMSPDGKCIKRESRSKRLEDLVEEIMKNQ